MNDFLAAIPAAAADPLALAAYAIAAVIFLLAGQNLRRMRAVMARIEQVPAHDRRAAIEIATNTKLPDRISPEHWIRMGRLRFVFLLVAAFMICLTAIAAIALTHEHEPAPRLRLNDTTR